MKKTLFIIFFLILRCKALSQVSFEQMADMQSSFFDFSNPVLYIGRDTNQLIRIDFLYAKNSTLQGLYVDTYFVNTVIDSIKIRNMLFKNNMVTQSDGSGYDIAMYCDKCPIHIFENIDSYKGYGSSISEVYKQKNTNKYFKMYEIIAVTDKFVLNTNLQKRLYPDYSGLLSIAYRVNNILSQNEYEGVLDEWGVERLCSKIVIQPLITK